MDIEISAAQMKKLRASISLDTRINTRIDERDEIFAFLASRSRSEDDPITAYFHSGQNAFHCLLRSLHDVGRSLGQTAHLLEFACGYGRVTRHILRALPPSRIDVSDIIPSAVCFQRSVFGVNAILSRKSPDEMVFPRQYDVIFVASLFSHLPERLWTSWLRMLHGALAPDGLLIFSVHGPRCLPGTQSMPESGFLYLRSSESKVLDAESYGTTYVTVEFVNNQIERTAGLPRIGFYEQGIWSYQDVYVVGNISTFERELVAGGRRR